MEGLGLIPVSIQLPSYILICHILCHGIKWTQKLCAIQLTYTQLQCIWICEENLIGSTEFIFKNYVLNYNVSLILRSYKWLGIDLSIFSSYKGFNKEYSTLSLLFYVFFFQGYLLSGYICNASGGYDVNWTTPQCILCLKLISKFLVGHWLM